MMDSLTKKAARRLALGAQGLLGANPFGKGKAAVLNAINHLGYIQIDPISVICRAHDHTLWNRNDSYNPGYLKALQSEGQVFEYWSHAASFLPMKDYRFCLVMMNDFRQRTHHWYQRDKKNMAAVLQRIRIDGACMSRDFAGGKTKKGMWNSNPYKMALHELFIQGDLMVTGRDGIQKIYDLPERVLPPHVTTCLPNVRSFARHLIHRCIAAHGLVTEAEIFYLRQGWGDIIKEEVRNLVAAGEVMRLQVADQTYVTTKDQLARMPKRVSRSRVIMVSPFDNAIIQRRRLKQLFDFDYQTEIYLPAKKRVYGYFSMPMLWGDRFVGRIDPKAERGTATMRIQNIMLEPAFDNYGKLHEVLVASMLEFARFNHCPTVVFAKKTRLTDRLSQIMTSKPF